MNDSKPWLRGPLEDRFEDLAAGDPAGIGEREIQEAAAALAESLPAEAPAPELKGRLMRRVASKGLGAVRSHEGRWKPGAEPGISYKKLYFDPTTGLVTVLVRMEPGARFPSHLHSRTEQCLILEGDLGHEDGSYTAGDFTWSEQGSRHPELFTRNGNLLLIISAPEEETGKT